MSKKTKKQKENEKEIQDLMYTNLGLRALAITTIATLRAGQLPTMAKTMEDQLAEIDADPEAFAVKVLDQAGVESL